MNQRMYEIEEFQDFFVEGEEGIGLCGHLVKCTKCGKQIVVEMCINGTAHHFNVTATCLECMEICDEFRESHPKVTAQVEGWQKLAGIV